MVSVVEVERLEAGEKTREVARFSREHGMAAFAAKMLCNLLNKNVTADSRTYYRIVTEPEINQDEVFNGERFDRKGSLAPERSLAA